MLVRTSLVTLALAVAIAPSVASAQVTQQRTGVLASIPLATDAVAAQVVGDTTLKMYTGKATIGLSLVAASKEVCYDINLTDVANPTEARIHKAPMGENGPSVLLLALKKDTTATKDCAKATDEVFSEISANPERFYLQVATTDHPAGAIRGQLFPKPPNK